MASVVSSDGDTEMHSASQMLSSIVPNQEPGNPQVPPSSTVPPTRGVSPMVVDHAPDNEPVVSRPSLDLLDRISGMFRFLDLVTEQGSNGLGRWQLLYRDDYLNLV